MKLKILLNFYNLHAKHYEAPVPAQDEQLLAHNMQISSFTAAFTKYPSKL